MDSKETLELVENLPPDKRKSKAPKHPVRHYNRETGESQTTPIDSKLKLHTRHKISIWIEQTDKANWSDVESDLRNVIYKHGLHLIWMASQ